MTARKQVLLFLYLALGGSICLLVSTRLVVRWGEWYSGSVPYRMQTEALLRGKLEVSDNLADLLHDHTWSRDGMHQVWGLGVPLWRLPFEIVGQGVGWEGFPDRLAFGLFACLVVFLLLRTLVSSSVISEWRVVFLSAVVLLSFLFFPPFLSLLQVRGAVWEEAVSYGYLYALLLLALLLRWVERPGLGCFVALCLLAGFGALVRPTLFFYGISSVLVALLTPIWSRAWGWRDGLLGRVLFGSSLFCVGSVFLWVTNVLRFGDGFEFGHRLNLQGGSGSMYATRFDDPFQEETLAAAVKELLGSLFLARHLNGGDFYRENIFIGQSETARFREFYFTTYDWTYIPLLAAAVWCFWRLALGEKVGGEGRWRKQMGLGRTLGDSTNRLFLCMGTWSGISLALMFVFYLYVPVTSSRYMMDFAAGIAALLFVVWGVALSIGRKRWQWILIFAVGFGWWAIQVNGIQGSYSAPVSVNGREAAERVAARKAVARLELKADETRAGGETSGIRFDREGWDAETGVLAPLAILFVRDADFLELRLRQREGQVGRWEPSAIRVKIGLEELRCIERRRMEGDRWIVRFSKPNRPEYRRGVEAVFVASVEKGEILADQSPWKLESIRWRGKSDFGD